jgi:hypothetical protein
MAKLTRINLGQIENLIEISGVREKGRGFVEPQVRHDGEDRYVRIKFEGFEEVVDRWSYVSYSSIQSTREVFLELVDSALKRDGLFLAEADYSPARLFRRQRVSGVFYEVWPILD